jgi:hypothetical protein
VKRRNEQLSMARTELHRRRLSQQGSDAISDTEQKENVRTAQRRLEEAEHKVALVKKWAPVLEHAITEYHSSSQPLGDRLTGSLMNSLALLDRTVASLDAYLTAAPPTMPVAAGTSTSSASPSSSSSQAAKSLANDAETTSEKPAAPAAEPEKPVAEEATIESQTTEGVKP